MTRQNVNDAPGWWASLKHGGMLIAPARLVEHFPPECPPLPRYLADRLRRDLLRVSNGDKSHLPVLLNTVLEDVLGLDRARWLKGSDVDARWSQKAMTGEIIKPRRVWVRDDGCSLPCFVADSSPAAGGIAEDGRLGIGRGKRPVSRVVEWLRRSGEKIALITNGRQWRLVHAGADYEAWCEWDTDLWFEAGVPGPQVDALRILLGEVALTPPRQGETPPILSAILASRRGQAELSAALGERVRLAVEVLIRDSAPVLAAVDDGEAGGVSRRDLYIAAARIVMRCVVVLFAEARDLLPRDSVIYHGCYGIQGLREQLARFAGGRAERLRHSHSAWPRLLSLFRLIHQGSPHEALPVLRYGGGLFAPGDQSSKDGVRRAIAAFENPDNAPTDAAIHEILELLCVSRVKVRQGRSSTWVPAPVDFSDLSSEYIGILYEGLLDFELHRAPDNDAVVFLHLGDEPALPLARLEEEMAPKNLAELIGKLKKSTKKVAAGGEETGESDEEGDEESDEATDIEEEPEEEEQPEAPSSDEPDEEAVVDEVAFDIVREVRERAQIWAEKAVKEAKLVPYPRRDTDPVVRERWAEEVTRKARALYRLILPGQYYLVRWGGTRKGAGTFYTRPQLAVPTVRRTLQPLCYDPVEQTADPATGLVTVTDWKPKLPEEILALKVCDPAMGSGSFLVAALRYLTDSLVESLHFHGRLLERPDGSICKLADGLPLDHPSQETLPVPPSHPEFEDRLRARLKRHVVERCIYGVDIDPLAVELARMALWVETMDRSLPFGFLDHKLRCGNSLVGCWFDRFQDYPVMAFERDDAGDKNHTWVSGPAAGQRGVWTKRWKEVKDAVVKPEMRAWIGVQRRDAFPFMREGYTARGIHDGALQTFHELHQLPVHESEHREALFREKIADNPVLGRLREALDTWCAIWFWPAEALDLLPTPKNFQDPSEATRTVVRRLLREHLFFHWELEFPDVFTGPGAGFDAVIGNPPWEIQKPSSKEFFSNVDPLYRTYGKQDALLAQREFFGRDEAVEHGWLAYSSRFKSLSTWSKHVAAPCGDNADMRFSFTRSGAENGTLHETWRRSRMHRSGYSDPEHPFRHQGSADINTYKMFCELGRALLRPDGYLGLITPSGLYTDKGSTDLRKLFIEQSRWEWLFGFENRQGIFDIHRSFKFNPFIVRKGGKTSAIRTAFMHRAVEDWQEAERFVLPYPCERVEQFSPRSRAILEIRSERDLAVLEKMYANSVLLGDDGPDGWGIRYATEFHMTNDSKLFPPRPKWEERGYRPNEYGMWIGPDGDIAVPLYQGGMIRHFDHAAAKYVGGSAQRLWEPCSGWPRVVQGQYLIGLEAVSEHSPRSMAYRLGFRDIAGETDTRTLMSTLLPPYPAGNTVPTLAHDSHMLLLAVLCGLCSYSADFVLRIKMNHNHVNWFAMNELPVPRAIRLREERLSELALRLGGGSPLFSVLWRSFRNRVDPWRRCWAASLLERLRLQCIADAVIAELYGVNWDDLAWVLGQCCYSAPFLASDQFSAGLYSRGFWRVDKEKDPELRHTVLTLVAFHELKRIGLDAFLALNDGEGWMLPETLRLADYGLGHDDRAKEHQPVAQRLGPRFLPWQLEQGVEESWEECERHAERLEALLGRPFDKAREKEPSRGPTAGRPTDLFGNPLKTDLFGNVAPKPSGGGRRGGR
jgi:hypothetical protein